MAWDLQTDGRFIACGIRPRRRPGPSPIKIFDLKNNVRVEPETVRTPELRTLEFDETGEFLATAVGDTALVWTLSKPGRPLVLEAYDEVSSVTFKPGTGLLASGSEAYRRQDHQTLLWNLENEDPPRNFEQKRPEFAREKPHILALRFSPDGNLLAAGTRSFRGPTSSVIVWDAKSSKQLASMEGHTRGVISLAFD
jgi:WD40 repeat protein